MAAITNLVLEVIHEMYIMQGSKVTLISTYTDTSGLFTSEVGAVKEEADGRAPTLAAPPPKVKREIKSSIDEEEELLYGDIAALTAAVKQEAAECVEETSLCIDLRELTNVPLFVQESCSPRRCASYCRGGREFPHTLVYTVPGRWVIGGVCGAGMGVRKESLVVYFLVCVCRSTRSHNSNWCFL